jgi:alkaline phosphatase D
MSRRRLLGGLAATAASAGRGRRARADGAEPPTFTHGVASGDPLPDRVVIWTRAVGAPGTDVEVRWVVAGDPDLTDVVAEGTVRTSEERDWTVHVDAGGLRPGTTHWYRFEAGGSRSPVGRTRTARAVDDDGEIRLGVVSCSSFVAGFFGAYARLLERDVDLVVHLGDYLYETSVGQSVRRHEPSLPPVTLREYRDRHAQHRSDPALLELHRRLPMAAVWDDHEVAGNAWRGGAEDHDPSTQGPWEERRAAALRAWREWLPLRLPDPERPERIWRRLPLGAAADLLLIDTRHDGRDQQVDADHPDPAAALADPRRRLLSEDQLEWLAGELRASTARWRVVANQVVVSPLAVSVPEPVAAVGRAIGLAVGGRFVNPDQWDGYEADRERLVGVLAEVGDTIVLTGDVHSSWAFELPGPGGEGADAVAVELVAPSVTAPSFARIVGVDAAPVAGAAQDALVSQLPHLRWAELRSHGYVVVGIGPDAAQAEWWHLDDVDVPLPEEVRAASWRVARGAPALAEADDALPEPRPGRPAPPPAPEPARTPPAADDAPDGPGGWLGAAGVAALAVAGAVVALRRRRAG